MREYLYGLATIPALGLAYLLAVLFAAKIIGWLIAAVSITAHRIKPDAPLVQSQVRAAVVYAAKRGLVFGAGGLGIILITGQDIERRSWASKQLRPTFDLDEHLGGLRRIKPGPRRGEDDSTTDEHAEREERM